MEDSCVAIKKNQDNKHLPNVKVRHISKPQHTAIVAIDYIMCNSNIF